MDLSQKPNSQATKTLIWCLLLSILSFWAVLTYHNWIADSEFWPITLSREIGHLGSTQHPAVFYKPLFHLSLYGLHLLPLDNVQHIQMAKALYAFVGSGIFLGFFLLSLQIVNHLKSFLFVLVLLSSALIFSNLGTIRSDVLATFFVVWGLLFWRRIALEGLRRNILFWLAWSGLLLGATPKAAILLIALFISYGFVYDRKKYFSLAKCLFYSAILFLGFLNLLFRFEVEPRPWNALISALSHGVTAQGHGLGFFGVWLKPYLVHDKLVLLVGISILVWGLWRKRLETSLEKAYWAFAVLIFFVLLFFEPKHLFFVASLLPFLFLPLISWLRQNSLKRVSGLLLLLLVGASVPWKPKLYFYSNQEQLKALKNLDFIFGSSPDATIFDGVGLLPRCSKWLFYKGPDDPAEDANLIGSLLDNKPDFIVNTPRVLGYLKNYPQIYEFYEPCAYGVFALKSKCPSADVTDFVSSPWALFGFSSFQRVE